MAGEVWVNCIVNRTSPTGSQRRDVCNVSDAAHGVDVVDFEEKGILRSANRIQRQCSNLLALIPTERGKISGEPGGVQFALADGKIHLRRGAYAVNAM